MIRDSAGRPVRAGDEVWFLYGDNPPLWTKAIIVEHVSGELLVVSPFSKFGRLADLHRLVGDFYVEDEE